MNIEPVLTFLINCGIILLKKGYTNYGNSFIDKNVVSLDKSAIDSIYYELNKELRKKFRGMPKDYRADLYVVGGANIVTSLHTRQATLDIDAM